MKAAMKEYEKKHQKEIAARDSAKEIKIEGKAVK